MTLVVGYLGQYGLTLAVNSRGSIGDPRGVTAINDTMVRLFGLSSRIFTIVIVISFIFYIFASIKHEVNTYWRLSKRIKIEYARVLVSFKSTPKQMKSLNKE